MLIGTIAGVVLVPGLYILMGGVKSKNQ